MSPLTFRALLVVTFVGVPATVFAAVAGDAAPVTNVVKSVFDIIDLVLTSYLLTFSKRFQALEAKLTVLWRKHTNE